jgi:DNA-binding CsgD family transcriptional regulator
MSETTIPSAGALTAALLVSLEPGTSRRCVESALVLLGERAEVLSEAMRAGLVHPVGDRLESADPRISRQVVRGASERQRRAAHLALACCATVSARGELFDRIRAELEGPRARPPESQLTPQERNVAELAATGAPTREIARAIYVSPRTVEYHLTRVYRKLGVRSKAELAFAFRT